MSFIKAILFPDNSVYERSQNDTPQTKNGEALTEIAKKIVLTEPAAELTERAVIAAEKDHSLDPLELLFLHHPKYHDPRAKHGDL